jgi:hypothetical protein
MQMRMKSFHSLCGRSKVLQTPCKNSTKNTPADRIFAACPEGHLIIGQGLKSDKHIRGATVITDIAKLYLRVRWSRRKSGLKAREISERETRADLGRVVFVRICDFAHIWLTLF